MSECRVEQRVGARGVGERRVLRVGFVPGVEPDRFLRRWKTARRAAWLELVPVPWSRQEAVLASGEVDMVFQRLMPQQDASGADDAGLATRAVDAGPVPEPGLPDEELHRVRLWQERAVAVVGDEDILSLHDELTLADLDGATEIPATHLDDAAERVAVAATSVGYARMPMSLARLHHRKDAVHRIIVDAPPTQIALTWPREADDDVRQEFVATVRGRTARSSR